VRRRDFIAAVGGAVAVWPLAARAQQPMPVIGFLHSSAPETYAPHVAAFRKGLGEAGFVEGRNVAIEYRWAYNDANRFPEMAADLVSRKVSVIVTPVNTAMALAAKAATATIPIVFSIGTDAVQVGLIASYNRPGGNVTGVSAMIAELGAKRLGLLLELRPQAKRIGLLINPANPAVAETTIKDARSGGSTTGVAIEVFSASAAREIDAAFSAIALKQIDGLVVAADPLFNNRRIQLATLAARHALPAVSPLREFVVAGALMSYGPDDADRYRLVGIYAGRVLKGEKPAEMPVQRPTAFQLVINMQTARALGITVPPTLLARADEVIE
jgi:putative ABC transport system substrate-binding protein